MNLRTFICRSSIAVVGLGYVGLPLALRFSRFFTVVGFDSLASRISDLGRGIDNSQEVSVEQLKQQLKNQNLVLSDLRESIADCKVIIITVPTPVDKFRVPDLSALKRACKDVGAVMSEGSLVIFESTVFPGCTRDVCVPILERSSNFKLNEELLVGYSPERINPGKNNKKLEEIDKLVSCSSLEMLGVVKELYKTIIDAEIHEVEEIETAEAAKIIENIQRDVNIGLINELSILFDKLGIDTKKVINAASTKWNFHPYKPGLVGGHCIGVDPYYLLHKAASVGVYPALIENARRINDSMPMEILNRICRAAVTCNLMLQRVLVLGVTFKENCPDIRNSLVIKLIELFGEHNIHTDYFDPWVDEEVDLFVGSTRIVDFELLDLHNYECIVLAVAHDCFVEDGGIWEAIVGSKTMLFDIQGKLPESSNAFTL